MKILVTGISGYVGGALVPRLQRDGHDVVGLTRDRRRVAADVPVIEGDVLTGAGLTQALDGVDVAYYLIHAMEASADGPFAERERAGAERFAAAARSAGLRRIVYLGGPVPQSGPTSSHLSSRLEVERLLLAAVPDSVALRASIVIGARSRSFRFSSGSLSACRCLPCPPGTATARHRLMSVTSCHCWPKPRPMWRSRDVRLTSPVRTR